MENRIDTDVKQKLLDSLSKEPTMVLSTAYVYAKNYVNYGEDITKSWTTAVQQASILEQVRQKAWVETYDSFNKDYEARLKADLEAILTEIQLEIDEKYIDTVNEFGLKRLYDNIIQEKINALMENKGNE